MYGNLRKTASELLSCISETLWPTRCIGCDAPGTLLCAACREALPHIDYRTACPRCGAPHGNMICTECTRREAFPFAAVRAAFSHEGTAARLITMYKDGGELRLDRLLAAALCRAATAELPPGTTDAPPFSRPAESWKGWGDLLIAVPATARAVRCRGFDHMQRVARMAASWLDVPFADVLGHRRLVADQRALAAGERMRNLAGSFVCTCAERVSGARILLVDDVFTTGATTSAAAQALLAGGACEVRVAVVTRVW